MRPRTLRVIAATAGWAAGVSLLSAGPASPVKPASVTIRLLGSSGRMTEPLTVPGVVKTEAAWRAQLTPEQYRITRTHGTERAFCGVFHDNHKQGVYACIGCGLPLFRSDAKFDSGTGWPSFFQPVAKENIGETRDTSHGMIRTEVHCERCGSHLGHVFEDGPPPSGLRYCINSDSLGFHERPAASGARERVLLGRGCFTGLIEVFRDLPGVTAVRGGYVGGVVKNPKPEDVRSGRTGHAEVVAIEYDPSRITLERLLDRFWALPFAKPDSTGQPAEADPYRSAIFFSAPEQEAAARGSAAAYAAGQPGKRPDTEIALATTFYPAEAPHGRCPDR